MQIHVDKYKMGVYKSLIAKAHPKHAALFHHTREAPYLVGFTCGNHHREGCLTLDENVRIHSCEKGTACSIIHNKPIVWIQPIVAHIPGSGDVVEVGLGGGGDDLEQDGEPLAIEDIPPLLGM
jgi:DNA cross-link repair 1C protein